jgi:glutathione reductase (NADPH)
LRAQDSKEFGWNINGDITFDWKRLVANKVSNLSEQLFLLCNLCLGWRLEEILFVYNLLTDSLQSNEIARLNGVYKKMLHNSKVEMYEGAGKVIDPHTVEVTETSGEVKRFSAKHILIATGGRAVLLDIPGKVGY